MLNLIKFWFTIICIFSALVSCGGSDGGGGNDDVTPINQPPSDSNMPNPDDSSGDNPPVTTPTPEEIIPSKVLASGLVPANGLNCTPVEIQGDNTRGLVTYRWEAVTDAESYIVKIDGVQVYNGTATTFSDSRLLNREEEWVVTSVSEDDKMVDSETFSYIIPNRPTLGRAPLPVDPSSINIDRDGLITWSNTTDPDVGQTENLRYEVQVNILDSSGELTEVARWDHFAVEQSFFEFEEDVYYINYLIVVDETNVGTFTRFDYFNTL